jgi:menaquinone-9 beta-reductase
VVVPDRADVVVVGGGPAGSSTATHLARAGLNVLLFDKARFPREKACAEYCSPGVVDALAADGVLDSIRAGESRDLPAMRIAAANQEIPLDFASDRPEGNQALGIKRSVLDQHLLEFARQDGVRVFEGTRVSAPIIDGNRVTGVGVKDGDHETAVSCEFVVAADGLHSTVVRHLSLDRPVRWPRRLGLVARYRHSGTFEVIGQMHVGDDIYCGLSPVSETDVNVSLVVPMGSKPHGHQTAEFFEKTLDLLPGVA